MPSHTAPIIFIRSGTPVCVIDCAPDLPPGPAMYAWLKEVHLAGPPDGDSAGVVYIAADGVQHGPGGGPLSRRLTAADCAGAPRADWAAWLRGLREETQAAIRAWSE